MNATSNRAISQQQINAALAECEFFLSTNNTGEIFANLRVGQKTQKRFPHFVSTIIDRLEQFDGAQIIWRGLPRHGWYALQFTSTLNHYASLSVRCAKSNIPYNRTKTIALMKEMLSRRDRMMKALLPTVSTFSAPVVDDPWESETQFHGSCDLSHNCDREPEREPLLLEPAFPMFLEPDEHPLLFLEDVGEKRWQTLSNEEILASSEGMDAIEKMQSLTKTTIAEKYLFTWSRSRIARTKKADLISAAVVTKLTMVLD